MAVVMQLGDEATSIGSFFAVFSGGCCLIFCAFFEQALPIELMSFSFRKDPALFFVDMMFDQFSEYLKSRIERG
jgi:hypothetical protein